MLRESPTFSTIRTPSAYPRHIKYAKQQGLLTVVRTGIVVNCPVIFTPSGGLFHGAQIIGGPPNGSPALNAVR